MGRRIHWEEINIYVSYKKKKLTKLNEEFSNSTSIVGNVNITVSCVCVNIVVVCAHVCVCSCAETRGQHQVSCLSTLCVTPEAGPLSECGAGLAWLEASEPQ